MLLDQMLMTEYSDMYTYDKIKDYISKHPYAACTGHGMQELIQTSKRWDIAKLLFDNGNINRSAYEMYNKLVLLESVHKGGDHKDQHPDDSDDCHHPAPNEARASYHTVDGVNA